MYNNQREVSFRLPSTVSCRGLVRDWDGDGLPDLADEDTAGGPKLAFFAPNSGTRKQPCFSHKDFFTLIVKT